MTGHWWERRLRHLSVLSVIHPCPVIQHLSQVAWGENNWTSCDQKLTADYGCVLQGFLTQISIPLKHSILCNMWHSCRIMTQNKSSQTQYRWLMLMLYLIYLWSGKFLPRRTSFFSCLFPFFKTFFVNLCMLI